MRSVLSAALLGCALTGCKADTTPLRPDYTEATLYRAQLDHDRDQFDGDQLGAALTFGWDLGERFVSPSLVGLVDERLEVPDYRASLDTVMGLLREIKEETIRASVEPAPAGGGGVVPGVPDAAEIPLGSSSATALLMWAIMRRRSNGAGAA